MTQHLNGAPEQERILGVPGETYEERFPRYAHNAGVTARFHDDYTARQRKAAELHARAAAYAAGHGDAKAEYLYSEMAAAALDAADALEDLASRARQVQEHYTTRSNSNEQEN
jgi:hypothetical protein